MHLREEGIGGLEAILLQLSGQVVEARISALLHVRLDMSTRAHVCIRTTFLTSTIGRKRGTCLFEVTSTGLLFELTHSCRRLQLAHACLFDLLSMVFLSAGFAGSEAGSSL